MKAILKIIAFTGCYMIMGSSQNVIAVSQLMFSSENLSVSIGEMKVSEFVKLSVNDFNTITGKKMNLKDQLSFSYLKRDMRKSLLAAPDQNVKDYLANAGNKIKSGDIIILVVFVLALIGAILLSSLPIF